MDEEMTEEAEELWCAEQRQIVADYLTNEGLVSPNVGDWPAWHIAPIVAVWAIESQSQPGEVGWWALSGDLPTDYTTCRDERSPRQALRDIGQKWSEAADVWKNGNRYEGMSLASKELERELAPVLGSRAQTLLEWTSDDEMWEDYS